MKVEELERNRILANKIFVLLGYDPHTSIVKNRLYDYNKIPRNDGFYFAGTQDVVVKPFLSFPDETIDKVDLKADLHFYDKAGKTIKFYLEGFALEVFVISLKGDDYYSDPVLIGIDELTFHLNKRRNDLVKQRYNFPSLDTNRYIDEGRKIIHRYYTSRYNNHVFDLYFADELQELYAIITNTLAFLYKNRDRVFGELRVAHNINYQSHIHLYPRFTNTISEVAGLMYGFWERISFVINEYFPLDATSTIPPSYDRYFREMRKLMKASNCLSNESFRWFASRIDNQHRTLGNLRHPTIHYNKNRSPTGMRSAHLMRFLQGELDSQTLEKAWMKELDFLTSELKNLNLGLFHTVELLSAWGPYTETINEHKLVIDKSNSPI